MHTHMLWEYFAVFGPTVLAFVGIFGGIKLFNGKVLAEHKAYLPVVVFLGIAVCVGTWFYRKIQTERLEELTIGGKNFPYIKADLNSGYDKFFDVSIFSSGIMRDVTYGIYRELRPEDIGTIDFEALNSGPTHIPVLSKRGRKLPEKLTRGIYQIEIFSLNGVFDERLVVEGSLGSPTQRFTVKKNDVLVYEEP